MILVGPCQLRIFCHSTGTALESQVMMGHPLSVRGKAPSLASLGLSFFGAPLLQEVH